jgi:hypothetical protein
MNIEYPFYKEIKTFNKKELMNDIKKINNIIYDTIPNELRKNKMEKFKDKYFIIKDEFNKTKNINNTTDLFSEENRIKCKFGKDKSPKEYWDEHKKDIIKKNNNMKEMREEIYKNVKMCNNFKITVALIILNYFKPKKWLDISAGWGDRLIASILYNIKIYESCDPNLDLHNAYKNIIDEMVEPKKRKNYIIHKNGFIESKIKNKNFDILFSSPPFFDLEKYSKHEEDSITKYKNEKEWIDKFFAKSLVKAYKLLKVGGHMILYMGGSKNVMDEMHKLDKIMKYEGVIYYYHKIPRAIYVWKKI